MGHLPVIPFVFRTTWNFTPSVGQPTHNVLHFYDGARTALELVGAIEDAISPNYIEMFASVQNGYGLDSIDVIALDGTSPTFNVPIGSFGGQASGQPIPNSCGIITLRTAERGRSHRGRVYLGPLSEGGVDNGVVDVTDKESAQSGWGAFKTACSTNEFNLVVASYKLKTTSDVVSVTAQPIAGTQRRRQSRLR